MEWTMVAAAGTWCAAAAFRTRAHRRLVRLRRERVERAVYEHLWAHEAFGRTCPYCDGLGRIACRAGDSYLQLVCRVCNGVGCRRYRLPVAPRARWRGYSR